MFWLFVMYSSLQICLWISREMLRRVCIFCYPLNKFCVLYTDLLVWVRPHPGPCRARCAPRTGTCRGPPWKRSRCGGARGWRDAPSNSGAAAGRPWTRRGCCAGSRSPRTPTRHSAPGPRSVCVANKPPAPVTYTSQNNANSKVCAHKMPRGFCGSQDMRVSKMFKTVSNASAFDVRFKSKDWFSSLHNESWENAKRKRQNF